jgi:hypothetical protein
MNILCTHPGRHGDLLWALPTVRALHAAGHQVTLALSEKYSSLAPLIRQQEYVQYVHVLPEWEIREDAPITPRSPGVFTNIPNILEINHVVHLGYDGWPSVALPYYVYLTCQREHPDLPIAPLDLERPWITATSYPHGAEVVVGFSDEWFELKLGLVVLTAQDRRCSILEAPHSRWAQEIRENICDGVEGFEEVIADWERAARYIASANLFLGCCSALHVLACAVGTPCVIAEPAEARHNPVFWPYGKDGPRVLAPKGNDGRQTWDARAIRESIDHFFQTGGLV